MALEDYKALFGNQFDDIVDAILTGGLTPQVEAMMIGTIDDMVFNVNIFAENINKTVVNMGKAGVSSNVIKSTLNTDMKNGGRIFGQLRNETKETLVGGVNKASGIGQYETYLNNGITEESLFTWITVSGHKVCVDCADRGGWKAQKFSKWEELGLPGSGQTVCKGYCYCVVDPVGKMDKEVKINTKAVKEKGASKPGGILSRLFNSNNKEGNTLFTKAFSPTSNRFKTFISKFPALRYIGTGGGRCSFYTQNTTSPFGIIDDVKYFKKHGGINIKHTIKEVRGVVRHEYGHYLHENLHHFTQPTSGLKCGMQIKN